MSLTKIISSEKDLYRLTFKNHFLFLIPPLVWNVIFTARLPMDHFSGNAPNSLLVAENIFRMASMIYLVLLPVNTRFPQFSKGLTAYIIGMLLYFGSWVWLMAYPEPAAAQHWALRFAPAYLPIIWLTGISVMARSWIHFVFSMVFIGLHVLEYVFRYV